MNYKILNEIPEKNLEFKSTTSKKWKHDLLNFFKDKTTDNCLEIGTNLGWTSLALSSIFNQVYTIEQNKTILSRAKTHCKIANNIEFIEGDAYSDFTYMSLPNYFNLVVIDCVHTYEAVISDINRALSFKKSDSPIYIAFDDYSHPSSKGVKEAIDYSIKEGLKFETHIGEKEGFRIDRLDNSYFRLTGPEGIILSYG
jgi:ubiquinone/menaquinone biosynthesis C-methylase UbiE